MFVWVCFVPHDYYLWSVYCSSHTSVGHMWCNSCTRIISYLYFVHIRGITHLGWLNLVYGYWEYEWLNLDKQIEYFGLGNFMDKTSNKIMFELGYLIFSRVSLVVFNNNVIIIDGTSCAFDSSYNMRKRRDSSVISMH